MLLCEQNFRDVWSRNESVQAEIGQILHTHTHTHAAKLVVEIVTSWVLKPQRHTMTSCSAIAKACHNTDDLSHELKLNLNLT